MALSRLALDRLAGKFCDLTCSRVFCSIETQATLIFSQLIEKRGRGAVVKYAGHSAQTMTSERWTKDQLKIVFNLYCQLPFGKLDQRNKEVIEIARLIGRTPGAVALKLVNFASLDPVITSTGRKGMANTSVADRAVWAEFHADWERLGFESQQAIAQLKAGSTARGTQDDTAAELEPVDPDYTGETKRQVVETRIKQAFFRRAVLSSYQTRCCMTGLADPRLLLASHIVPWSKDKPNRLNPKNGLCLSALHDKAFDRGVITVLPNMTISVSKRLVATNSESFASRTIVELHGKSIELPRRFVPDAKFLHWHNSNVYLGD